MERTNLNEFINALKSAGKHGNPKQNWRLNYAKTIHPDKFSGANAKTKAAAIIKFATESSLYNRIKNAKTYDNARRIANDYRAEKNAQAKKLEKTKVNIEHHGLTLASRRKLIEKHKERIQREKNAKELEKLLAKSKKSKLRPVNAAELTRILASMKPIKIRAQKFGATVRQLRNVGVQNMIINNNIRPPSAPVRSPPPPVRPPSAPVRPPSAPVRSPPPPVRPPSASNTRANTVETYEIFQPGVTNYTRMAPENRPFAPRRSFFTRLFSARPARNARSQSPPPQPRRRN